MNYQSFNLYGFCRLEVIKITFSLLLCFFYRSTVGQSIQVKINNPALDDSIISGNILFFDKGDSTNHLKEFLPVRSLLINYDLQERYERLLISIRVFGYKTVDTLIEDLNRKTKIAFTIDLLPNNLTPVTITAPKPPYQFNGDTTKYSVDGYKDGTERTLEDLIKKLPGLKVNNNTGEISYKGIPIETLMIDGINLFEKNYTIASRTIDISLIDTVSVIENFLPNPLLMGLTTENRVALSVSLKDKSKVLNHQLEGGGRGRG